MADGCTASATWDDYGEWYDDRFGELVHCDESLIGQGAEQVAGALKGTFWDGATAVRWLVAPGHAAAANP